MANVIEVLIKGLVSEDFKKAIEQASQSVEGMANKIGQNVENINRRFEGMNKGFEALGKSMVGIGAALSVGVTAPTVALAAGAIHAAANIEKLTIAFQPLLGSAGAANKRMQELQQFANATPFELPEVAKASRMLEVLTKGALATGDALRMVGDVASGTGQQFDEVAMWVGRLYDGLKSGRPVGEATMRLQEMGAMSGDTRTKLEEMAKEGAKFSEIWGVATEAFGRFSGGMKLQADSVSGKFSTLQDSANTALAALGKSFEDVTKKVIDLATALTDKLASLAQWFGELPEPIRMITLVVVALVAAIGPLLVAFGGLLLALPGLIAGWAALIPLIGAATAALGASALAMTEFVVIAAVVGASLYKIAEAAKAAAEWWGAYREASQKAADVEQATSDALARRAVGREYRQDLRKAGIDVGMGGESSQSQQGGSYAAYQEQEKAKKAASDAEAAKIHSEFSKTDRATLIAKENKAYEDQKALIGGNVQALAELNKLHDIEIDKINKKFGPKKDAGAEKEMKAESRLSITQAQDRFKAELDADAKILKSRQETVILSISGERFRELEALSQRMDHEMAAANGNKALLLSLHDQARAERAEINKKWDKKDAEAATKAEIDQIETAKKNQKIARDAFEEVQKTQFSAAWVGEVNQRIKSIGTGAQQAARMVSGIATGITNSISGNITAVITRTKSLTQGMKDLGREILQSVVGGIVKAGLEWVQMEIMKATMSKAMAAASLAVTAPIAAAQVALWTAPATLATIATFGGAAAAAPAEIAGSISMTKALASFDVGTPRVPRDMVAQIHKDEMIVPASMSDAIRKGEMSLGGGSQGGGSHAASLVLDSDILAVIKRNGSALLKVTQNQGRVSFS